MNEIDQVIENAKLRNDVLNELVKQWTFPDSLGKEKFQEWETYKQYFEYGTRDKNNIPTMHELNCEDVEKAIDLATERATIFWFHNRFTANVERAKEEERNRIIAIIDNCGDLNCMEEESSTGIIHRIEKEDLKKKILAVPPSPKGEGIPA